MRRWPTVGARGACKADGEGGLILCGQRDSGFHRTGVEPVGVWNANRAIRPGGAAKRRPQDREDGVQAMTGSRGAGRRGLHILDDMGGKEFQVETSGTGDLPGVREETGKGITDGAPQNPTRRGKRGIGAGGQRGSRGRKSQDLKCGISREGWT